LSPVSVFPEVRRLVLPVDLAQCPLLGSVSRYLGFPMIVNMGELSSAGQINTSQRYHIGQSG
jgi:hypothetical protein